jgi:4-hydroxybenzoate polyprenyltransferase
MNQTMSRWLQLLRVRQWYKNAVLFLAIFFSRELFNTRDILLSVLGFFILCAISSASYILNDIIDREADRVHPEKRNRPLAAGTIRVWHAAALACLLAAGALALAAALSMSFFSVVLALVASMTAYSLWLKRFIFIDILTIAANFVLRAIAGVVLIAVALSPWLVICVFFLALFLVLVKRRSDVLLMPKTKDRHKSVLKHYTVERVNALLLITSSVLVLSYCLYSFLRQEMIWLVTIPLVLYGIFRYLFLADENPELGRHPEKVFADPGLVITIMLWGLVAAIILYGV